MGHPPDCGAIESKTLELNSVNAEDAYTDLLVAIDTASGQQRRTWLTSDGKRIAIIGTVDDGNQLEIIDEVTEAAILREAAAILFRRFPPLVTEAERKVLMATAIQLESR